MHIRLTLTALALLTAPAFAEGCWDCDPEPPPPPPPVVVPPLHTGSDSDPVRTPVFYPCCIKDGEVVVKYRDLFSSVERTKLRCELAIARGNAVILECDGVVSPEATK